MPETSTQPAAAPAMSPTALRIVLFGLPDAGKSSLLGALAQAAQTQQHVLSAKLTDRSGGLASLQTRLYEERPRETLEEIAPFPVTLEPFPAPGAGGPAPVEAVLIDCDGRAANDILARKDYLRPDGSLARAVLEADTLVLVVDASANPAQLERDFSHFGRFLELLEKSRGQRSDVGGLPVYLVLTKCDLLAQKNDTSVTWIDHIEERKRHVGVRFREFLTRETDHEPAAFGSIDLHLWATAVKRPALADAPARPREPFGVAELFRQCFDSAGRFHRREARADVRLRWTLIGSIGLLAAMGLLAAVLFFTGPGRTPGPLEVKIDNFRAREQEMAPAQKHQRLDRRRAELATFRSDPAFADLPADKRDYVEAEYRRLTEDANDYRAYEAKVAAVLDPQNATTDEQLQQIEDSLSRLTVPEKYKADWAQSPAVQRRDFWLRDVEALRGAVEKAQKWYQKLYQDGKQVLDNLTAADLPGRARKVLREAKAAPFPEKEPDKLIPGAATVSYSAVYNFAGVVDARDRWEEIKKKLEMYSQ
jgi:hypothetical protein